MPLSPGTRLGPYEVESLIGSGGMGEVYRATDTRLQRAVAIKVLPGELTASPIASERFQREARMASRLNHPSICTIYDVGVDPLFIAMELLEGESLQQRLRFGPMDVPSLIAVATAIAEGLEAAHSHGLIHRDIKPANIFLTSHGPKLLDFGLAKAQPATRDTWANKSTRLADAVLTDSGATVGTTAYMSPEQLRGLELDARTDVFSLGLVLYEMATGRRAFAGATGAAVSGAILYEQPVPPRELRPDIPVHLDEVILKALEKDREDRYQTAADLRADLRRLKREVESRPLHGISDPAAPNVRADTSDRVVPASDARHAGGGSARPWLRWLGAGGVLVAGVVAGLVYWGSRADRPGGSSVLPVEGAQIVQLTSTGDAERPAIAPDGKYLAYVRQQNGQFSLQVRQTTTAATVEIVPAEPEVVLFGATVSPDSRFVDYIRRVRAQAFELWRVPFLGGAPKRLLERVYSPIGWSPDGQRFALIRVDPSRGATAVVVVNADGSGERVLIERQRPAQFVSLMIAARPSIAPTWSRDGRRIAVVGAGAGASASDGDVALIDVETGAQQTLPLPTSAVRGLVWFDDGTLILNAALSDSSLQFHLLSIATGQLSAITRDVNDYDGLSLSADGQTLIASRRDRRTELRVVDPEGRTVASGPGIDIPDLRTGMTAIKWAADRVVYGNWAWTPGSAPQPFLEGSNQVTATADGTTVVFRRGTGLWKVDSQGGTPTQLTSGEAWYPAITPDNRWVVFLSSSTGIQSPWIVSMDGAAPRQLVARFAAAPGVDVSRDGKRLAFFSRDEETSRAVIVICAADGSGDQQVLRDVGAVRVRWTPDGRAITYVDAGSQRNLWTMPSADGTPRQITRFDDRVIIDFDWSPDGTKLVVARRLETNDIVLLKGLRRRTSR